MKPNSPESLVEIRSSMCSALQVCAVSLGNALVLAEKASKKDDIAPHEKQEFLILISTIGQLRERMKSVSGALISERTRPVLRSV